MVVVAVLFFTVIVFVVAVVIDDIVGDVVECSFLKTTYCRGQIVFSSRGALHVAHTQSWVSELCCWHPAYNNNNNNHLRLGTLRSHQCQ
eukprot:1228715-Pyramimonas_sp.AAC.1